MGQIFLTATLANGISTAGGNPRVVSVSDAVLTPRSGRKGLAMVKEWLSNGSSNKYTIYENPAEIAAQILVNAGQGTTLNAKNYVVLAAAALGATYAASLKLTKYFTEVLTATVTSADGVGMAAAAGSAVGTTRVIVNTSGVALELWPPTGEKFDTAAIDAAIVMPANKRYHFVIKTAGVWTRATDFTEA